MPITVQIDTPDDMRSLAELRKSLKATAEAAEECASLLAKVAAADIQQAIFDELRAVRGLLEKQQASLMSRN